MTSFCAVCTDEVGPFAIGDLDGRSYVMCQKCLSEHPPRGGHVDMNRGYYVREEPMTIAEFKRAVDTFARNVDLPPMELDRSPTRHPLRHGEELVRVPMRVDDKPIDADDAVAALDVSAYSSIHYRGTSHGYHVFGVRRSA